MVGDGDKHVCCVFENDDEFPTAAARFLRRGLHQQRLLYIADRPSRAHLLDDLIELGDAELLSDEGDLVVQTAEEAYFGDEVDAARQIETFRSLVQAAQADGFSGLRVAADVTALVDDDENRRLFMSYELAVDRFIASTPIWGMCGYNGSVLADKAADLACVHRDCRLAAPEYNPGFRLWTAGAMEGAALAVGGEIDASNADRFAAAMAAGIDVVPLLVPGDEPLVVDASGLEFIDAEGTTVLARLAERLAPRAMVVAEPPRSFRAVIEALGLHDRLSYVSGGGHD